MSEFNAQDLSNTAWAFATANHRDENLFAFMARATEQRLSEFKPQEISNAAWASAMLKHRDEKLFAALAK